MPLVVIFLSRRKARRLFYRDAYPCPSFRMRNIMALDGFEGNIFRVGDEIF
jgi:hypothetical protein